METTTAPLFNRTISPDPGSLSGALFLHCRSVEDVLLAGGHAPGVGYAALDVVRVAAILMTAPGGAEDRFARWLLPEPERAECLAVNEEDSDLPF
jgi:hypothetical protein